MTREQIEAKKQELLNALKGIYFKNEVQKIEIKRGEKSTTFINFYINPNLCFSLTSIDLKKLFDLNLKFFYSPTTPHFYYIIHND